MASEDLTTVRDLGRLAGCSIATVSRVLNNSAAVSVKKREAILQAIRETDFHISRARRGGRRNAMKPSEDHGVVEIVQHRHSPVERLTLESGQLNVGPLVSGWDKRPSARSQALGNAFHRGIVDGAIEELATWGYRAQMRMNTDLLDPVQLAGINANDRSGVLLIGEYSDDLARFVRSCTHPVVLVDLNVNGQADVVTTDNFHGVGEALEHLFALGHRRIGYVGRGQHTGGLPDERLTAFKLKMTERGVPIRPDWLYDGYDHIEETARGVELILRQADRPTALMCGNDCYALGVVRAASRLGISIPDGLSLVGFDDVDFASLITPPLTTVRVPVQEMGRQAVRQLMIHMKGTMRPRSSGCRVRLLPELVVRESTAAVTMGG
ncbi:MAG TPA: LacI family DNA-binding transcriptional regulator [Tepidisphaeraceae bacterium]|jgi:DNA-binding LacI/PurR family transcriptional regulator|nr:LacI family DNA-binding transcriptional regulator [Tepidisphaeraceae bacterium]